MLLGLVLGFPGTGFACTCAQTQDAGEAYNQSDAVMWATVQLVYVSEHSFDRIPLKEVTVKPIRVWKQETALPLTSVYTADANYCGTDMKAGKIYLIYASETEGKLVTQFCGRSDEAARAVSDLFLLESDKAEGGLLALGLVYLLYVWYRTGRTG